MRGRVTKLADQLCHNKALLRSELDLLAGDARGATPIGLLAINDDAMMNEHAVTGGYAGVAVSLMRAWQEERGPTTKSARTQSSRLKPRKASRSIAQARKLELTCVCLVL